jgi:SAM-dependent methyltransferase
MMTAQARHPDWLERWQSMCSAAEHAQERVQQRNYMASQSFGADSTDPWRYRSAWFSRYQTLSSRADTTIQTLLQFGSLRSVWLDVGAGTGRHALALAKLGRDVIAVEPSASMRSHMVAHAQAERLETLQIRSGSWPDPHAPCADVIYSCHVLYGIKDVVPFLTAMTEKSYHRCVLLLKMRAPSDMLSPLWAHIHGFERPQRPAAMEAFLLLHQLGIQADFQILRGSERAFCVGTSDTELDDLSSRLSLPIGPESRKRVWEALNQVAQRTRNNDFILGTAEPNVTLAWPGAAH